MHKNPRRSFRAFCPSILELERLQMLDGSQSALSPIAMLVADASGPLAVAAAPPAVFAGRLDSAVGSMLAATSGRAHPSSLDKAVGRLGISLGAGLRLGRTLSAVPDGFSNGSLAVARVDVTSRLGLAAAGPVVTTPAVAAMLGPAPGPLQDQAAMRSAGAAYALTPLAAPRGGGGRVAWDVAGGPNSPWTITYTNNPDGSITTDLTTSDSYGDPSAAGTDVGGMDSASVPNGGTDSFDLSVTEGDGSVTVTIDVTDAESYGEKGTITGPTSGGTFTISGSDSYHYHDSTTLNADGTSSETSTVDANSSDKYNATVSGSGGDLAGFTLTVGGSDGAKDHQETTPAGGAEDHQDDTSTANLDMSGTTLDGAKNTGHEDETVGYKDDKTPSSDTTTKTNVGSESAGLDNSGSLADGGSFTVKERRSDTYDNKDTTVVAIAGGVSTLSSDDEDDKTANTDSFHLTVGGVPEGPGSSATDAIDLTVTGGGTLSTIHDRSPGSDILTEHATATGSGDESGNDGAGPFDSAGKYATEIFITVTDGDLVTDDRSPPPTPPTAFGSLPTGPINDDVTVLRDNAYTAPAAEADAIAADDQIVLAQGPAKPPNNPLPPLPPPVSGQPLKDYSVADAIAIGDVEKLKTIREAYEKQLDIDEKLAKLMEDRAKNISDRAPLAVDIDLGFIKFKSLLGQIVREAGAKALNLGNLSQAAALRLAAGIYTADAARLGQSIQNINAAIIYLVENPPKKP